MVVFIWNTSGRNGYLQPFSSPTDQMSNIKTPDMPASFSYASLTSHPRRRSSIRPDRASTTTIPPVYEHEHEHQRSDPHPQKTVLSQKALFRAAAPPLLFAILIAACSSSYARASLRPPRGATRPRRISTGRHDHAARAHMGESRWPGPWALPVLCLVALGALRAAIWACAAVLDSFEERVDVSGAAGVRIGRWEDGGSVSGSELLAGMFT
ncbi:hypothetical protein BJV77DRAFT_141184 [Russula vinacea]|nr:hypothetical protein BJV77DRAFT_141184 [Russula vinacea]